MSEQINHPTYYGGDTRYEAIKVIEAWQLGFCLGNTVRCFPAVSISNYN